MAQRTRQRRPVVAAAASTPQAAAPGWWDRLPDRTQHLLCLLFLLVVSLAYFAPVHFSGKSLVASDTVQWRAMSEVMLRSREATGEEPLWAPNAFGGMPGYMINYENAVPQLDDVPRLLRQVVWPTSHFFVLLAGAYLLLVLLTGSKTAGVAAALGYGLTSYLSIILVAGHNTKFIALCFAPWLVLAFVYALRRPRLLSGLLFAAALALNLRAGHVQITYYVVFLLGIWWIAEGITAFRQGRLKGFGVATAWLALGGVLGVLMVAQPYLPTAEYKAYTVRGAATGGEPGGLDWQYAMNWSQGWGELLTLAVADAYGGGGATYWGPKPFTGGPHYVGGVVLLLAALALVRGRRTAVWALGIGALLMTLFSLGEHFEALNRLMFAYFPLFDAFRVPETWLSTVAMALAVLAGIGLYVATRRDPDVAEARATDRAVLLTAGAAVALALLVWLVGRSALDFERPNEAAQLVQQVVAQRPGLSPDDPQLQAAIRQEMVRRSEARVDAFSGDALRTFLFVVLAAAALVLARRRTVPLWGAQLAVVLLILVDLWGVGRRYVSEETLVDSPEIEAQIPTYGFDQYILQQQGGRLGQFRVLSFEGDPNTSARPSYHFESLGGYSAAKLRLYQDFLDHLLVDPTTGMPVDNALDMMNTRYIIAQGALPGMRVVYQDPATGFMVSENPDVLPRGFFVGRTEVVASAEATWERIRSRDWNPRQSAILPEAIDFTPAPLDSSHTATASLTRYTPNEIEWQVETDAPRLFVASEVYYPAGWKATIDGQEAPIYRADYLLRAVPVPAGRHTLVMRFEPASHRIGVATSAVSTVVVYGAIVVLLGLGLRRRRRGDPTA